VFFAFSITSVPSLRRLDLVDNTCTDYLVSTFICLCYQGKLDLKYSVLSVCRGVSHYDDSFARSRAPSQRIATFGHVQHILTGRSSLSATTAKHLNDRPRPSVSSRRYYRRTASYQVPRRYARFSPFYCKVTGHRRR